MTEANVDRYFVLGNPVAHSQSPFIHEAFAAQTNQAMSYGRRLCPMDDFAHAVRALALDDQGGRVRGCNITLPFKFEAPLLADRVTTRATLAQAANVLRFDETGWLADNTDGIGLMRDIQLNEGLSIEGQQVLLLGAGGAGAGVLGPLITMRPARVVLANRTADRAARLCERHKSWATQHGVQLLASGLDALPAKTPATGFDLVINASATSLSGGLPDLSPAVLAPGCTAADLMYGPPAQIFLEWARQHGAGRTVDGLGMLVEQAAEAFELWRGVRPTTQPVLQALRQRLAEAAKATVARDSKP